MTRFNTGTEKDNKTRHTNGSMHIKQYLFSLSAVCLVREVGVVKVPVTVIGLRNAVKISALLLTSTMLTKEKRNEKKAGRKKGGESEYKTNEEGSKE